MAAFRRLMIGLLWLLFIATVIMLGYLALKACGIRIPGYGVAWCPAPAAHEQGRKDALLMELGALERAYRQRPLCQLDTGGTAGLVPSFPGAVPRLGTALPGGDIPSENGNTQGPGQGSAGTIGPAASEGSPPGGPENMPMGGGQGSGSGDGPVEGQGGGNASSAPPANGAGAPQGSQEGAKQENPPDEACAPSNSAPAENIVLALDHSKSMALPVDVDDGIASELEALMEQATPAGAEAKRRYDAYIAQPGTRRLDVLKEAVRQSVGAMQAGTDIGLVTFAGCRGVADNGVFGDPQRGELISRVQALQPQPATPVANALKAALERARAMRSGRVILVSDGRDTCSGDPCAIAASNSGVRVDVISMGGGQVLSCVAEATGGRLLESGPDGNVRDLLIQLTGVDRRTCP